MRRLRALLLLTLVCASPSVLGAQAPRSRWEILIRGPATTGESAEIRFDTKGARILLESADSTFLPVTKLVVAEGRISFNVPGAGLRFQGEVHDTAMTGQVAAADGAPRDWSAWPLPASLEKWPVRPRLVVSQLLLGRRDTSVVIPGAWVAAMPARSTLAAEYRRRLVNAGLPMATSLEDPSPEAIALGLDATTRAAAHTLLEQIAKGPAGGSRFIAIFGGAGHRRLDIHDRALEFAKAQLTGFQLSDAARGISALGGTIASTDSLGILAAAWRLWNQLERDSVVIRADLEHLRGIDIAAANSLTALLQGYDVARRWWEEAVTWLLTSAWWQTATGPRSPSQLVATFWGRDSLPLPAILTTRFGGYEAHAFGGIAPLASRLIKPANAIAVEWLARHGVADALLAWRRLDAQNDSLQVQFGGQMRRLTSPMGWARGHYSVFMPAHDVVMVDPGIVPIFAVATLIHEWQHLQFTAQRFRAAALRAPKRGMQILNEDPWLSEGAAEWATDAILSRGGSNTRLLQVLEAGKRFTLERDGGDDPHATGYRLVMAVASRGVSAPMLRQRLAAYMHDPLAFARASGFIGNLGARPLRLESPVDAVVIPEISFTWDTEYADHVQRRLIVPPLRPEH